MAVGQLILFIVTSHSLLGDSGIPTGWYLPELAHPFNVLSPDFSIVVASPKGGPTPMDPISLQECIDYGDAECVDFLNNVPGMTLLNNTIPLEEINPADYAAVFFPGGHGPMYDLDNNTEAHRIVRSIYEAGGVVAGVCHGPAGFVNLVLSDDTYFVSGKQVTAFTNEEEDLADRTQYMPFMLEDALIARGGSFSRGENWAEHVVVDGRFITGQNPNSAGKVAREIAKALNLK